MSGNSGLRRLSHDQRVALCREVMESLSEIVEGEAAAHLCEKVDEYLDDCQAFVAYRDTLAATIRLAQEHGRQAPAIDEERFERCVEAVRRALHDAG